MTATNNIDEIIRRANPVTSEPDLPDLAALVAQLDLSVRPLDAPAGERGRPSPWRRPALRTAVAAGALAGSAGLAVALIGGPGGGVTNVAAAVERAISPQAGVLHTVSETVSTVGGKTTKSARVEAWATADPRRTRTTSILHIDGETVESESAVVSVNPPRTLTWVSGTKQVRESTEPLSARQQTPDAWLREAYAAGRVVLSGHTELDGQPAWRLTVKRSAPPSQVGGLEVPAPSVIVSANTFVPLLSVVYSLASQNGSPALETQTTRYLTYEQLPADPGDYALLNFAAHPGTETVAEPPPSEH